MLEKVSAILTAYGYTVGYSSYHIDSDIKRYAHKRDHVSEDKFLTVYTPSAHVVGRVHNLKQGEKFTKNHLLTIIGYFEMFEINHRDEILGELKKLSKSRIQK